MLLTGKQTERKHNLLGVDNNDGSTKSLQSFHTDGSRCTFDDLSG